MKKMTAFFMSMLLAFSFAACGNRQNMDSVTSKPAEGTSQPAVKEIVEIEKSESVEPEAEETEAEESSAVLEGSSNVLIVYFSVPEDVDTSGTDAVAGASLVVKDGERLGNTEYVAKLIQKTVGGDLFRIETVEPYPLEHETLVDQAAEEQDADLRPELTAHVENFDQYDYVLLGFPNWWADMPQPLYTFLEEYDLSGKTIIPFVTHGGSGFSNTEDTIAELQPNATVSSSTLSLSRNSVADSKEDVVSWANSLGLN